MWDNRHSHLVSEAVPCSLIRSSTGKGREVATVTARRHVADAVAALAQHNVGALVVSTDGSSVDGILSERDIVRRTRLRRRRAPWACRSAT